MNIGYRCTNSSHNKFHVFCGQQRIISSWKYCVDKDGNGISGEPISISYVNYTCEEDGCGLIYTSLENRQEGKVRFYVGEYEPSTYEDALNKFNTNTHFDEQEL